MKKLIAGGAAWALPALAFAGVTVTTNPTNATLETILATIGRIINGILPIVIALGVIFFLWGVVGFITAGADEEKKEGARNLMIYGIIGLFVMVSVWGLVAVLAKTFGVGQGGSIQGPGIPTSMFGNPTGGSGGPR